MTLLFRGGVTFDFDIISNIKITRIIERILLYPLSRFTDCYWFASFAYSIIHSSPHPHAHTVFFLIYMKMNCKHPVPLALNNQCIFSRNKGILYITRGQ